MIKQLLLCLSLSLLMLAKFNLTLDQLQHYAPKDIGLMVCISQGQETAHLSDEELIIIGQHYFATQQRLAEYLEQQQKSYKESVNSAQIKQCQEKWFRTRRINCLNESMNQLSNCIVPTNEESQKSWALEEYEDALIEQKRSEDII